MNLNPITALADQFEKLINEHGSAAILRDHVALLRDQTAIFEKKASLLESENANLKMENQNLNNENDKLKQKLQIYEQPTHDNLPEDIQIRILFCISENGKTVQEVSTSLNIGIEVIKFHLNELKTKNMVTSEHVPMGENIWFLEQDGRKLLIQQKLIS